MGFQRQANLFFSFLGVPVCFWVLKASQSGHHPFWARMGVFVFELVPLQGFVIKGNPKEHHVLLFFWGVQASKRQALIVASMEAAQVYRGSRDSLASNVGIHERLLPLFLQAGSLISRLSVTTRMTQPRGLVDVFLGGLPSSRVLGSLGVSPTTSVIQVGIPLSMNTIVFGKPFPLYHRSGHSPQPCPQGSARDTSLSMRNLLIQGFHSLYTAGVRRCFGRIAAPVWAIAKNFSLPVGWTHTETMAVAKWTLVVSEKVGGIASKNRASLFGLF